MLLSAVLFATCVFGGYSSNLSNYPRFYQNQVVTDVYYDVNKESYANGYYEVFHFHDHVVFNVDFEKDDEGIHVYFNDVTVRTYKVDNAVNDSETLIGSNVTFYNDIGDGGTLLKPNDDYRRLVVSHSSFANNGTSATFQTSVNWYDDTIDSSCGVYYTNTFTMPNSSPVGTARYNTYKVSLDDLYNRVVMAFSSYEGGYYQGYSDGYRDGSESAAATNYDEGYADGYADGVATDETAFTIFNGILTIGMIPINVFLAMFDFTVLGINISNFIMSLLTVLVTIWVIRTITGGGKGGSD